MRTIAISASAMMGGALVCFRAGTIDLLCGRHLLPEEIQTIFGIPNTRMSSCAYFRHFLPLPCLDNFISGIPNAIASPSFGSLNRAAARVDSRLRSQEYGLNARGGHDRGAYTRCRRIKKQTSRRKPMSNSKDAVRKILDSVKADKRTSLTAPEGKLVCDAYGIAVPKEGVATSAAEAVKLAADMGFPVVLKIVSPE